MTYLRMVCYFVLVLLQLEPLCYGGQLDADIDIQVVAVFATKDSGLYHKPWRSPNFMTVRGSGFFFEDDKTFPGMKGLILTNAHAVAMAQSIKVSNGREKRRYKARPVGICNSADFAVLQMGAKELETYEGRNGKVMPLVSVID